MRINVGGEVFVASRSTLVNSKFFAALLGDDFKPVLFEGVVFVDRSPQLFPPVLAFLRSRVVPREPSAELLDEAEFYGVADLADALRAALEEPKEEPESATLGLPSKTEGIFVNKGRTTAGFDSIAFSDDKVVAGRSPESLAGFCLSTSGWLKGEEDYAVFVRDNISRGVVSSKFGLQMTLTLRAKKNGSREYETCDFPCVIVNRKLLLILIDNDFWKFNFVAYKDL